MPYKDAIGQSICRGDTVTLLNPPPSSAAAGGDYHYGVVLCEGRPGPYKLLVRLLDGSVATVKASDVRVSDRSFMQSGMVVASSTDVAGQLGTVTRTATELDLVGFIHSHCDRVSFVSSVSIDLGSSSSSPAAGAGEQDTSDLARLTSAEDGNDANDVNAAPAVVVVATAVSPAEVRRAGVGEFCVRDYVVSASSCAGAAGKVAWLGCVVEVCLDVDVVFDDGAKCRVPQGHTAELWTTAVNKDRSKNKDLYPGQRVRGPPGIFKASRWLKGHWKANHGEGTVSRVETTGVVVFWIASSSQVLEPEDTAIDESSLPAPAPPPPNLQRPCELTFLCHGRNLLEDYTYWGVGDRCFFRGGGGTPAASTGSAADGHNPELSSAAAAACTGLTTTRRAAHREWRQLWRKQRSSRRYRSSDDDDLGRRRRPLPLAVARTRTTVDVVWQDGTRQRGVPSTSLVVWDGETENDLFPGHPVVRRTPAPVPAPEGEQEECVGLVRCYNYKDKTVCVSWDVVPESGEKEEMLSAYDVISIISNNTIHNGDIVVRRRPLPTTETDSPSSTNGLSWVGQHVYHECERECECEEGQYIFVKWSDGNTSKVLFREIAILKRPIVDGLVRELGEWVDQDRDMNNAIDDDDAPENNVTDDENTNGEDDDDDNPSSESDSQDDSITLMTSRMNLIGVIIQAVIGQAGKVFSHGWRYLVTATESNNGDVLGSNNGDLKVTSTVEAGINGGDSSTVEDKTEASDGTGDDKPLPFPFPQFEIVQKCPSDHHYLVDIEQGGTSRARKWTKRVQKEWKILENNLPDTIYVRVFEDRMDLLRAVMVGASGTPYHDGLFFFDLQLPPLYPDEPPLVYYCSFGLDVNPNLCPSGTVCLSLLNTFEGQEKTELWSPEVSTILQVVVSIQGLVLTAQPYYNESGWAPASTPIDQRNAVPYSESAFLQSLQTMLHVVRRPPAGFEEFVRDHFRRRGQHVIRACQSYRDGCLVGTLDMEGNPTEGSKERQCSAGFKIALLNVLPRLVEAFDSINA